MTWLRSLAKPSLDWLLVFVPSAVVAEVAHSRQAGWASPLLIFGLSALAIIPLAGWMGRATEHLAARLGEGIGGLLNATLGNAAELIIASMALWQAAQHPERAPFMHAVVKASITGSIIGNILLVLGGALLVGGLRHRVQRFNAAAARTGATLLTLATAALLIPALFAHIAPARHAVVENLSIEVAVVLLVVYGLSLLFSLHTHKHLYSSGETCEEVETGRADPARHWSIARALGVMLAATIGVGFLAEFMVGSVESAAKAAGLTEIFVGVVVVAIVGNAAEHSTAILVAWHNRMDLALSIAVGSSIQVALFLAPFLVILSHLMGGQMDFVYTVPEVAAVGITVLIMEQIAGDGESHWLEGVLLLTVYAILGLLFFHLPA